MKHGLEETLLLVGALLMIISGLLMVSDSYAADGERLATFPRETCRDETPLLQHSR